MTNADLIKRIKTTKGPIFGTLLHADASPRIRIVKRDLIDYLIAQGLRHESGFDLFESGGSWILDTDI